MSDEFEKFYATRWPEDFDVDALRAAFAAGQQSKQARIEELERELGEIALAVGYAERPWGVSGVLRASGEYIARAFKAVEARADAAEARVRELRGALQAIYDEAKRRCWDETESRTSDRGLVWEILMGVDWSRP